MSSRSRRPIRQSRREFTNSITRDVQGERSRQAATFASTSPRTRRPSARPVSRHRGVAINELVFTQRHEVAELSAQPSKTRIVRSSSPELPYTASSSHRCGQRFSIALVCGKGGNPLHKVEDLRPVYISHNLVVREIGELVKMILNVRI